MVTAIAISLTVFAGVLYAWGVMGRETGNAYVGTEPASATILLDKPIDLAQMAAIAAEARSRPGIIEATGRTQFTSDVEVNGRLLEIPLQVFVAAPDDSMRMARFYPERKAWPPPPGEIFIARDSLGLLGVAIGDTLTVLTPGGQPLQLRVADTVYDPSLSPSAQEHTGRAYMSTESLTLSGAKPGLDQLKVRVADPGQTTPSRDRSRIVAVTGELGEWLERERGLGIREIQVPPPYAHPHQWQADSLLMSLLAGGAAAVLLSTILVATMLNGLFTQQIPQIGIMKAIGARSRDIGRLYIAMTLAVSGAATLLALAPSILIGRELATEIFGFLGIKAGSLAAPWWTYGVVLATGLLLPPLLALFPLIRASRITVRAAIDHRGLGSKPGATGAVVARLSRFRRLDRGLLMALRNTTRRPARSVLAIGLLASAGTVFVAGVSLSASVAAIAEEQTQKTNWDVDVQLRNPIALAKLAGPLAQVPGLSRTEGFYILPTGLAGPGQIPVTRTYPDQGHGRVSVTAIPSGMTTFTPPSLREGRWLKPGEIGAVVINQVARNNTVPNVHTGDTVQLLVAGRPSKWRVVGVAEERGGGAAVYASAEGFAEAMGQAQQVNQLRIILDRHDEPSRAAAADAIDKTLTSVGVDVSAASVSRREAISEGHLGPIITIVLAIAIAMGVIGSIGLASTMSANILDRTREFGVMHAIGARPQRVRRIVTAEGVFLAAASFLAAVIPTLGLTALLGAGLGNLFFAAPLPYRISVPAVFIWTAIAVLGAALATAAAAGRASRITVRQALAYI